MKSMNSSYGRKRGDLSGAKFCGRIDIYWDDTIIKDAYGRYCIKHEIRWTGFSTDPGLAEKQVEKVATEVGGEILKYYYNRLQNHTWIASPGAQIVVVNPQAESILV